MLGGIAAEKTNLIGVLIPTYLGGAVMIISAYYINRSKLKDMGKTIMVSGFIIEAFVHFSGPLFVLAGLLDLTFATGIISMTLIAIGWRISLIHKEE